MSLTTTVRPLLERPSWVSVAPDVVVGRRGDSLLGTVQRTTAGYVAVNRAGEPLGLFESRKRAQSSLSAPPHAERERLERAAFLAASTAGAVAASIVLIAGAAGTLF